MVRKFMISKTFRLLSMVPAVVATLATSPQPSEAARTFPARGGSPTYASGVNCWSPEGPRVTNVCWYRTGWYIPLVLDGALNGWVTVRAQASNNASGVSCFANGWDSDRNYVWDSGLINIPQFGSPASINMQLWVPSGGTGMVDCDVGPSGQVISASF